MANKRLVKNWSIAIIIILLIIIGWWGIQKYKSLPKPFKYVCREENPCKECKVVASCVQFEELNASQHNVHFQIKNQYTKRGDCSAQIYVTKDNLVLTNRTIELGILEINQTKKYKLEMEVPDEESSTSVTPSCEW